MANIEPNHRARAVELASKLGCWGKDMTGQPHSLGHIDLDLIAQALADAESRGAQSRPADVELLRAATAAVGLLDKILDGEVAAKRDAAQLVARNLAAAVAQSRPSSLPSAAPNQDRAAWAVKVLDAWAKEHPDDALCARFQSDGVKEWWGCPGEDALHTGDSPDAVRIAAAESLVAADPSLNPQPAPSEPETKNMARLKLEIARLVGRAHEADGHNDVAADWCTIVERIEELVERERQWCEVLAVKEPAPTPEEDFPPFGCDPGDSAALEQLRMAIDDHLIWPSEEVKEAGDYEAAVRHCGELALRWLSLHGVAPVPTPARNQDGEK